MNKKKHLSGYLSDEQSGLAKIMFKIAGNRKHNTCFFNAYFVQNELKFNLRVLTP